MFHQILQKVRGHGDHNNGWMCGSCKYPNCRGKDFEIEVEGEKEICKELPTIAPLKNFLYCEEHFYER
jgi:hypothetical protein